MKQPPPPYEIWKTEEEIRARIHDLAKEIQRDYRGQTLHIMGILRGTFIFMADLIRVLELPTSCQFINLYFKDSPHGDNKIKEIEETVIYPAFDINGKNVLVLSAVLDTGVILDHILSHIRAEGAKSARAAALIDKTFKRRVDIQAEYSLFKSTDDSYFVGYGLDYIEKYHHLPFIARLK